MSNFNKVDDKTLQAYNRLMFARNLQEDAGYTPASDYLNQFSKKDHLEMAKAMAKYDKLGEAAFKRSLTKNLGLAC